MEPLTDTYLPWFILREIPGLGNRVLKQLLKTFKTPEAVLAADENQLAAVKGMGPKGIRALAGHGQYEKKPGLPCNGSGMQA